MHGLQSLLWDHGESRLPVDPWLGTVVTCAVGGLLVGLLRHRHDADLPHDVDDALNDLDALLDDEEGTAPPPRTAWLLRAAALGVVSLGFGASLGPEAPLLVMAMGFGTRIGRILRVTQAEAAYISSAGALSGLFGGPLGSVVLPVEGAQRPQVRMLGYGVLSSVAGLVVLFLVLPDQGGHRIGVPVGAWPEGRDLVAPLGWAVLTAVPAALLGLVLLALTGPTRRLAETRVPSTVVRGVAGGLVLGACGAVAPLTLFSGQHQTDELLGELAEHGAWALIALALLKLVATLACLATGWFGGQIFPAIFAGLAIALALTPAFPDAPVGVVVAAGAGAATTAVLRRPLASVLLLLFYFPPELLIAMVVGSAVATLVTAVLGDRAPQPSGLSAH